MTTLERLADQLASGETTIAVAGEQARQATAGTTRMVGGTRSRVLPSTGAIERLTWPSFGNLPFPAVTKAAPIREPLDSLTAWPGAPAREPSAGTPPGLP